MILRWHQGLVGCDWGGTDQVEPIRGECRRDFFQ